MPRRFQRYLIRQRYLPDSLYIASCCSLLLQKERGGQARRFQRFPRPTVPSTIPTVPESLYCRLCLPVRGG